jgi:dynein heavy chain
MQEFREDVKNLMRGIGGKGQPTTFIFNDNSIREESFLEDVNNILNTGEVPNIFSAEERVECCDLVRNAAKDEGKAKGGSPAELFAFFIERCKKFCHIVLAFSPIGDALRKRILAFPSLVNCTTIDWFSEWPADALESVAQSFLADLSMEDEVRQSCVTMVQIFHTTTSKQSKRFLNELKRNYYVTPTSFLELISTFIQLLNEKRKQVTQQRDRYANGFKTLIETESKVNIMSEKLEALKPQLIVKAEEVGKQTVVVTKEVQDA